MRTLLLSIVGRLFRRRLPRTERSYLLFSFVRFTTTRRRPRRPKIKIRQQSRRRTRYYLLLVRIAVEYSYTFPFFVAAFVDSFRLIYNERN